MNKEDKKPKVKKFPKKVLSVALGVALLWGFNAYADIVCTAKDADGGSLSCTDTTYTQSSGTIAVGPIFTVDSTGTNSDTNFSITFDGDSITLAGYSQEVTDDTTFPNVVYYPVNEVSGFTTTAENVTIGSVIAYLGKTGTSDTTVISYNSNFAALELLQGWNNFSSQDVTLEIQDAVFDLYSPTSTHTTILAGADVNSLMQKTDDTSTTPLSASFGNISVNVSNVGFGENASADSAPNIWVWGLATGANTHTGANFGAGTNNYFYGTSVTANSVSIEIQKTTGNFHGIRVVDNEGGIVVIGTEGNTGDAVSLTVGNNSATPEVVQGVFSALKGTSTYNNNTYDGIYQNMGENFYSDTTINGNVTISISGTTQSEGLATSVYGVQVNTSSTNTYARDTTVTGVVNIEISGDAILTGSVTGVATWNNGTGSTVPLVTKIGSISIDVENMDHSDDGAGIYGIEKYDSGTMTVGNVDLSLTNITDGIVQGVYVESGTIKTGSITLNLSGVTTTGVTDADISGALINGTVDQATFGGISITAIEPTSHTGKGIIENIYGVAVTSSATLDNANLSTGDINVAVGGIANSTNLTASIYGFVSGNDTTYTGYGTRTLTFGTSSQPFLSYGDYVGTFANFDKVVVASGSILTIFSNQSSTLTGDETVFGSSDGISSTNSKLNGIISAGGTVTIPDSTTFEVESSAVAAINDVETTGGSVENSGALAATTFDVTNGSVVNNNIMLAADLEVSGGTVSSSSTLLTAQTVLSGGTTASTDGTTVTGGNILITNGNFVVPSTIEYGSSTTVSTTAKGAYLEGGLLKVTGGTAVMSLTTFEDSNGNSVNMNSKVYVGDSAEVGFGDTTETLTVDFSSTTPITYSTTDSALIQAAENFGSVSSGTLALSAPVTTGSTGYIQVGGSYEDPVGLSFQNGSTLALTSSLYEDSSAIAFTAVGTSDATINVASGAALKVSVNASNEGLPAQYYVITKNYSYGSDDPTNWQDYLTVYDNYDRDWSEAYEVQDQTQDDTDYVILYRTKDYPKEDFCQLGYVACNNIQTDIETDDPDPGPEIVKDIVGNPDIPLEDKVKIMNSIANLPFAGGVIGVAMNGLMGDITDLNNHLTMDSDTFGAHGIMWPYDEFNNMWLDVHGTWYNQKHLSASGIDRAGWRANAFGFILGYDRKLKDRPVAIGAAFSFTGGNVKSTGNISYTKNKYQEYGAHLYANYSPNEHLNVIGALHWMHNVADVTQNLGLTGNSGTYYSNAHGHMNTDWLAVGVRFETSFSAGAFTFIPHVEPRYVYSKMRNFDTQINGIPIWRTHAKGNNFFQIPVGIAARADYSTESGWIIRPNLDVTLTPQVGSTKLRTTLTNVYNAVDAVEGQFMGRFQAAAKLGVQFERKAWTLGAKYGVVGGDRGRIDHGFIIQTRLRF